MPARARHAVDVRAAPLAELVKPVREHAAPTQTEGPEERLAVAESTRATVARPLAPPNDLFLELGRVLPPDAEQERQGLVRLLAQLYLKRDDPSGALAALERYGCTSGQSHWHVAEALRKSGDGALAARAYLTVLEGNPGNRSATGWLAQLDPEAAIVSIEAALAGAAAIDRDEARTSLAELYAATGNSAEARRLVEQTLLAAPDHERSIDLLLALDPFAGEARYRVLAADREQGRRWNRRLALLFVDQGRADEAADLLETRLRAVPDDKLLRGTFISIAPLRGYDYLLATLPIGADDDNAHDLWGHAGDELFELGERERALEAWRRAVLAVEDPDTWSDHLDEHFPEHTVPVLEERARLRPEPESFGSLADAYWRAGRGDDALAAWRHAAALDPDEDEWAWKLAAAGRSADPLGY
jgi:tetratricopeptide (TPR) repeat protein